MKIPKINIKKIILGIPIALISVRVYLGVIFGYLFARFLSQRLDSVIFSIGNYDLHLHHWMMGLAGFALFLIFSFSPLLEQLFIGFLSGLIFEGVTSYSDWHRILTRKEK